MKVAATALLLGAATSAVAYEQQQVLQMPKGASELWSKPLHNLEESLKTLTGEARALWDEIAMMFPESFEKASFFSSPKPHTRKADSEWDHVTKGAEVQSVWVKNADGAKEREVGGKLENYNLRTKSVDPSALGIDKVKQYSGYLDDEENDKHLFYCRSSFDNTLGAITNLSQGSSSPATTPRTTPWCFGKSLGWVNRMVRLLTQFQAQRWSWMLVVDWSLYGAWSRLHQQEDRSCPQPILLECQRFRHFP